jgi:nicotinamide mononucleotide transporter
MTLLVDFLNAPAFALGGLGASHAELIGAVLGVLMVVCNWRVNPLAWPLAIASSALYALVFWEVRLLGQVGLQLLFIALGAWGWWQWLRGREADGQRLHVARLSGRGRGLALLAVALLWPPMALLLTHAGSAAPWWDALPTAGSLVAQVLLARKRIENWTLWIGVNVVSLALFAHQGLALTAALYALFALMAVIGLRAWQRLLPSGA